MLGVSQNSRYPSSRYQDSTVQERYNLALLSSLARLYTILPRLRSAERLSLLFTCQIIGPISKLHCNCTSGSYLHGQINPYMLYHFYLHPCFPCKSAWVWYTKTIQKQPFPCRLCGLIGTVVGEYQLRRQVLY